ncbi:hypothetical protein L13192_04790 [Pyrenophora tritici-repentis]|uniref:Uncharacterized protein n=1 Tax=Pyrenophora tritici-repentis TaxID=45151 RepID=A0A922NGP7_9PLEO|nr:hypothetical protein Ptr86124_004870 [Pyrenophora tritici-repentis]KAI1671433.1 hypothetical protein L13192_04790 [Pyrenophora tritici-repentis]KAI1685264.1 hypothetical protein KJE20_05548 [Pyrenophora tritici-repentis]
MEGMDQPNPADIKEYLDMGWVHKELIPFLEEVFTDDEGMSTSNWERMILFARFNLDKIPVHEDFPSTIERLRLCLINASLLTSYELGKFMRIASMGPQTCVRVFVRHAIRHGPYRLHSLGDGPNPCSPRPEQDGTQAAVVIIPKPPKPDVVKKLEAEVKALTLKLEKYENEKKEFEKTLTQKNPNLNPNQYQDHQSQTRQNQNEDSHNNHQKNHGRPPRGQRTRATGQDHRQPQHPGRQNAPFGHNQNQNPGMYSPAGAQTMPYPHSPSFFPQHPNPPSMYGMNPQPYTAMPHYQQQTRLDIQRQAFDSYAPPASFPTQAPHVWSHNQHPHNSEHPTFPSESTTGFQRIQLEQTRPAPQQVQSTPTSGEEQA